MRIILLICFFITLIANAINVNAGNEGTKRRNSEIKKTDCTTFEIKGKDSLSLSRKLTPIDSTVIPVNFPQPPTGSLACGCYRFVKTSYYLSSLSKDEIFAYYSNALRENDFFVRPVEAEAVPNVYKMPFDGEIASGFIYVFTDKSGFGIKYVPKKPCNCPEKAKNPVGQ